MVFSTNNVQPKCLLVFPLEIDRKPFTLAFHVKNNISVVEMLLFLAITGVKPSATHLKSELHPLHSSSSESTTEWPGCEKCKSVSWGVCTCEQNMWHNFEIMPDKVNFLSLEFYYNGTFERPIFLWNRTWSIRYFSASATITKFSLTFSPVLFCEICVNVPQISF